MAGRFSYSRPERRGVSDPWFRIGDLDVGSAMFLAILSAASLVAYAVNRDFMLDNLVLAPSEVLNGQIWRIITWPLVNEADLWTVIAIALLGYFGTRLEEQVGRTRMTVLLATLIVVPGILATLLDLHVAGVRSIELAVLLIFVAEYPHLRFFFGIPAWVLGLVLVAIDVLDLISVRANEALLFYLLSLVVAALGARSVGLLTAYPWIPQIPVPGLGSGTKRQKRRKSVGRSGRGGKGSVVEGPWTPPPPPSRPNPDAVAAQAELDQLLDKISADGLDSLTSAEKQRLNELSKRLR